MVETREAEPAPATNRTTVERTSERELVVTRTFNAPARLVFEAWTRPELPKQWWVPKSMGMSLLSLDADVRTGGRYRLVFRHEASTMEFFGKYIEVTPPSRIVWTNEESGDNGSVTTVTFEETDGRTLLVKIGVLTVVFGTGAYNWLRVRPALGTEAAGSRLRRSAILELAVGAIVLAVTAVLVATPPPACRGEDDSHGRCESGR